MAIDPIDDACQRDTGRKRPGLAPAAQYRCASRSETSDEFVHGWSPTRKPSLMAATLLDLASALAIVEKANAL